MDKQHPLSAKTRQRGSFLLFQYLILSFILAILAKNIHKKTDKRPEILMENRYSGLGPDKNCQFRMQVACDIWYAQESHQQHYQAIQWKRIYCGYPILKLEIIITISVVKFPTKLPLRKRNYHKSTQWPAFVKSTTGLRRETSEELTLGSSLIEENSSKRWLMQRAS